MNGIERFKLCTNDFFPLSYVSFTLNLLSKTPYDHLSLPRTFRNTGIQVRN